MHVEAEVILVSHSGVDGERLPSLTTKTAYHAMASTEAVLCMRTSVQAEAQVKPVSGMYLYVTNRHRTAVITQHQPDLLPGLTWEIDVSIES